MQKYCFFSIICYVEFQKTAYQKSGHSPESKRCKRGPLKCCKEFKAERTLLMGCARQTNL